MGNLMDQVSITHTFFLCKDKEPPFSHILTYPTLIFVIILKYRFTILDPVQTTDLSCGFKINVDIVTLHDKCLPGSYET